MLVEHGEELTEVALGLLTHAGIVALFAVDLVQEEGGDRGEFLESTAEPLVELGAVEGGEMLASHTGQVAEDGGGAGEGTVGGVEHGHVREGVQLEVASFFQVILMLKGDLLVEELSDGEH